MLALSAVDHGLEPRLGKTKDLKIGKERRLVSSESRYFVMCQSEVTCLPLTCLNVLAL